MHVYTLYVLFINTMNNSKLKQNIKKKYMQSKFKDLVFSTHETRHVNNSASFDRVSSYAYGENNAKSFTHNKDSTYDVTIFNS